MINILNSGVENRCFLSGVADGSRWPGQDPPQQEIGPFNEMGRFGRHMPYVRHAAEGFYKSNSSEDVSLLEVWLHDEDSANEDIRSWSAVPSPLL